MPANAEEVEDDSPPATDDSQPAAKWQAEEFEEWLDEFARKVVRELPGGLELAQALRGREMEGLKTLEEPVQQPGEDDDEFEPRQLIWEVKSERAKELRSEVN